MASPRPLAPLGLLVAFILIIGVLVTFGDTAAVGAKPPELERLDKRTARTAGEEAGEHKCRRMRVCTGFELRGLHLVSRSRAVARARYSISSDQLDQSSCSEPIEIYLDRSGWPVRVRATGRYRGRCPYLRSNVARVVGESVAAQWCQRTDGCQSSGFSGLTRADAYGMNPQAVYGIAYVESAVNAESVRCERQLQVAVNDRGRLSHRFLTDPDCQNLGPADPEPAA